MVKMEAEAHGVSPTWSEIVGLVPERALFETAARHIQLRDFSPEHGARAQGARGRRSGGESLEGFVRVGRVVESRRRAAAASRRTPARSRAALAQMVAGLTVGRKKYAAVDAEMREIALQAAALGSGSSALVERDAQSYDGGVRGVQASQGERRSRRRCARPRSPRR